MQEENPIRNYYANQSVDPRHIQKFIASVAKAGEGSSRKRNKILSHKLPFRLSQFHYKNTDSESSLELLQHAHEVNNLLKLSSIRVEIGIQVIPDKSYFVVERSCFKVKL